MILEHSQEVLCGAGRERAGWGMAGDHTREVLVWTSVNCLMCFTKEFDFSLKVVNELNEQFQERYFLSFL
jgi:hypothetical protein